MLIVTKLRIESISCVNFLLFIHFTVPRTRSEVIEAVRRHLTLPLELQASNSTNSTNENLPETPSTPSDVAAIDLDTEEAQNRTRELLHQIVDLPPSERSQPMDYNADIATIYDDNTTDDSDSTDEFAYNAPLNVRIQSSIVVPAPSPTSDASSGSQQQQIRVPAQQSALPPPQEAQLQAAPQEVEREAPQEVQHPASLQEQQLEAAVQMPPPSVIVPNHRRNYQNIPQVPPRNVYQPRRRNVEVRNSTPTIYNRLVQMLDTFRNLRQHISNETGNAYATGVCDDLRGQRAVRYFRCIEHYFRK